MKKEVRQLRQKAINALVLSIDHFNRPWDRGRTEAVLIMLDHSFEMLLKAAIRHRQGKIRKPREKQTIGFDSCVRKALTDGNLRFLTDEQALTLQTINGQRDAAQHYLIDMSEHQLYFYAQAGVTLFRDIHDGVFDEHLVLELPERVLPVSTTAPRDLSALFDKEVEEIKGLLAPRTRRKMDAVAKARSLAVLEGAVKGDYEQPSDHELKKVCKRLSEGESWVAVYPGVAAINITADFDGPSISLRLTKNVGTPVHILREGEGSGGVLAVRTVNELGFYSLGANQLASKVGLTPPKSRTLVDHLGIREDEECFKEIRVGRTRFPRFSPKAITRMKEALKAESMDEIWASHVNEAQGKEMSGLTEADRVEHMARRLTVRFLSHIRPYGSATVVFSDTVPRTCAAAAVVGATFRRAAGPPGVEVPAWNTSISGGRDTDASPRPKRLGG